MRVKTIVGLCILIVAAATALSLFRRHAPRTAAPAAEARRTQRAQTRVRSAEGLESSGAAVPHATPAGGGKARTPAGARHGAGAVAAAAAGTSASQHVLALVQQFRSSQDPDARIRLAGQMRDLDDPEAVRQLLNLALEEPDADVRAELFSSVAYSPNAESMIGEVIAVVAPVHQSTQDSELRVQIQDTLGEVATKESAEFLRRIWADGKAVPEEKVNAAHNLLRLWTIDRELLPLREANEMNERLRLDAQAADGDLELRMQAIMALAERRQENAEFFRQLLAGEKDANVRRLLEQFSALAPPAFATPAPSPAPANAP